MIQSVCCLSSTAPPQDSCSLDGMRYGYKADLPWIPPGEVVFFFRIYNGCSMDVSVILSFDFHMSDWYSDCFHSFVNVQQVLLHIIKVLEQNTDCEAWIAMAALIYFSKTNNNQIVILTDSHCLFAR